ncbi:MAG: ABC transporter permease [bacterium]|nr:ABC transporter permease [bacterium]
MKRSDFSWRHVGVVFRKELLDTSRDRRTWFGMVIMPLLLVPLLLLAMPVVVEGQMEKVRQATVRVAVVGAAHHPGLVDHLKGTDAVEVVTAGDPEADLADRRIQAIVYLPEGLAESLAAEIPAPVRVAYDGSDQNSVEAQGRIVRALSAYSALIVAERLAARGMDPVILHPLGLSVENLAPPRRMIGFALGLIMPMMLAMWATLGGLYAAIDAAAGEKERGTLEPLLSAPPARIAVVLGKYFTVVLTSMIAAGISMLGMVVAFTIRPTALLGPGAAGTASLAEVLPPAAAGTIFLVALGLAGVFSALQLAVSLRARSFREAQTYLSPLSLMIVMPAVFTQFMAPDQVPTWFYYVPLLNSLMVFKEALMGIVNPGHIVTTLAVSLVGIRLTLGFAVASFRREQVLFRV